MSDQTAERVLGIQMNAVLAPENRLVEEAPAPAMMHPPRSRVDAGSAQGPHIGDIHPTGRFSFRRFYGRAILQQEFTEYRRPPDGETLPGWCNFWVDVKFERLSPKLVDQMERWVEL
jgi:hypothetical protein